MVIDADDPLAHAVTRAIQHGDHAALTDLLAAHPLLATTFIQSPDGTRRSLLHVATDWPGHFPNVGETIALLVAAGASVDARFVGAHTETPLHWAASSDDVAALDALLDCAADIEADGAVIAGGTPLADATAFAQWAAARRLVERGAHTTLFDSAALGLIDRIRTCLDASPKPANDELDGALWAAGHGNQPQAAQLLIEHGADRHWISPWDSTTPAEAAARNGAQALAHWLRTG